MKLIKNGAPTNYGSCAYGIEFDTGSQFLLQINDWGKNIVISSVDNSLSQYHDHKKKDILVLDEGPANKLDDKR